MNRAWKLASVVSRRHFLAWSTAFGVAGLAGSRELVETKNPLKSRPQIGDDPINPDTITTIGSKTTISNTEAVPCQRRQPRVPASRAPAAAHRPAAAALSCSKRTSRSSNATSAINTKQFLDDPAANNVARHRCPRSSFRHGAESSDRIDVQITLPEDRKTTSLLAWGICSRRVVHHGPPTDANVHSQILAPAPPLAPGGRLLLGDVWAKRSDDDRTR